MGFNVAHKSYSLSIGVPGANNLSASFIISRGLVRNIRLVSGWQAHCIPPARHT